MKIVDSDHLTQQVHIEYAVMNDEVVMELERIKVTHGEARIISLMNNDMHMYMNYIPTRKNRQTNLEMPLNWILVCHTFLWCIQQEDLIDIHLLDLVQ